METTSVMFIENTPHGTLARKLQECEDKLGATTGRRVRMVEMGGTQLAQLLPNTNPWSGAQCGRAECHTCHQGGGEEKRLDCFKRNVLYESRCGVCEDKESQSKNRNRSKLGERVKGEYIYVGETSRIMYERCKEHINDGKTGKDDSHIAKHWEERHPGEAMPEFRFRMVKSFQDPLSRQVAESVRIDLRGENILNSKTVYSRNKLPRLVVQKEDWELRKELKEREDKETERKRKRETSRKEKGIGKEPGTEIQEPLMANEDEMNEHSRQNGIKRTQEQTQERERNQPRPKRKKRKDRREEDVNWGQKDLIEEDGDRIREWLKEPTSVPGTLKTIKQPILFSYA